MVWISFIILAALNFPRSVCKRWHLIARMLFTTISFILAKFMCRLAYFRLLYTVMVSNSSPNMKKANAHCAFSYYSCIFNRNCQFILHIRWFAQRTSCLFAHSIEWKQYQLFHIDKIFINLIILNCMPYIIMYSSKE